MHANEEVESKQLPAKTSEALSTYPRSSEEVCVGTLKPLIIITSGAATVTTFRAVINCRTGK